ncbi:hypothetical protein [Prauserella cavernicola]|uniref:Uncharacterized protein n=1 Tax=Prauserella cavernicola TaxID=2800127 RepID=A0A934V5W1_9PSEU|nr:hypothetical protein [Prauserella cavernicola]MBK1786912.1 hypothetical protein [Prauserella cavernicola]
MTGEPGTTWRAPEFAGQTLHPRRSARREPHNGVWSKPGDVRAQHGFNAIDELPLTDHRDFEPNR